jgi:hypothetical protein
MSRPFGAAALNASLNAPASKERETTSALKTNAARQINGIVKNQILRIKPRKGYSVRQVVGKPGFRGMRQPKPWP